MAKPLYPDPLSIDRRARRLRRLRRRVRRIMTLVYLVLAAQVVAFAFTSPHLRVNRVVVEGAKGALAAEALSEMQAGIGANIFLAPLDELSRKLSEAAPFLSVSVSRRWPLTLVATVRLRTPYAIVRSGQAGYLLDGALVPYAATSGSSKRLPEFAIPSGSSPKLGQNWPNRYLQASAKSYEAARDRGLVVRRISIDRSGDMCFNIEGGIKIRAGAPHDIERKLWVASQFLASKKVPLDTIDYVDVSCPAAPVYAPKRS